MFRVASSFTFVSLFLFVFFWAKKTCLVFFQKTSGSAFLSPPSSFPLKPSELFVLSLRSLTSFSLFEAFHVRTVETFVCKCQKHGVEESPLAADCLFYWSHGQLVLHLQNKPANEQTAIPMPRSFQDENCRIDLRNCTKPVHYLHETTRSCSATFTGTTLLWGEAFQ